MVLLLIMKYISILLLSFNSLLAVSQPLQTVIQQGHELAVLSVAISPDSNFVVSTSRDKTAKLWEINTGREVRTFSGHEASVTSAALSPDGKHLLTGSNDKQVKIWDVESGKELYSHLTSDYISDVVIDTQKKFFIYAGYNDTGAGDTAMVLDWNSKEVIMKIAVNPDKGLGTGVDIAISNDGKWVAFGEDNRSVMLFETASWKMVHKFEYPDGFCGGCGTQVVFDPDNQNLYLASHRGTLKKYELSSFGLVKEYTGEFEELKGLSISPDGKQIAVAIETQVIIYNTELLDKQFSIPSPDKGKFHRTSFTLDSKVLMIASDNNTVIRFNVLQQKEQTPLSGFLKERDKGGLDYDPNFYWESHIAKYVRLKNALMISRDGKSLIKGKFGTKVRQWDIATGKSIMDFVGHKKAVLCSDLSADGKTLLTGGGDGKIILWDFLTGDSLKVIKTYKEPIFDIHFNSDETLVLSASWDATMKIHDLQTGKLQTYFSFENGSAYNVLYHPSDLYVFTARLDNSLQMWEIDTRSVVRTFVGHTDVISALNLTKDQKTLISSSWDGSIRIWDIATGLMSRKILHSKAPVHACILSPDDKIIFSAGTDRVIRAWDIATGKLIKNFQGHNSEITSLVISVDNKMLISHSVDGVTKFWNLDSGNEFFEHIHLGDRDWLVKNNEGYFNGTDGARKYVHFVKGLKTFNVDQFFEEFYRPDLLPKIFQTRGGNESQKGVNDKLKKSPPPVVKIALLPLPENKAQVLVRIVNSGSGVSNLRLLHNGKSITINQPDLVYPLKEGEFTTYKHELNLIGGNNTFTAIATNNDNVESDPRIVEIFTESEVKHSTCHILAVGINEYKNSKLNLNYAKPDAVSFSKIVNSNSTSLFKKIRLHTLYDQEASRFNILRKLDELAAEAQQEDVFIFYYAGHGSMIDNKFYFIPTENLRLYDQNGLQKEAIEARVIQEKLKNIAALKQLIVMDACQSGGSVELLATRGANEEKAIAQLSRSTGIHVLASAGSEQFAAEFSELGHGLFTYVLIKGLEGEADGAPKDGKVTIYELKSYIDDQVPEQTRKMKGKPQYPYTFSRGQDFPVVMKP
jgi:WD40 repeat protein